MKKVFAFIAVFGMLSMSTLTAQDSLDNDSTVAPIEEIVEETPEEVPVEEVAEAPADEVAETAGISQSLKLKFIEGGPLFMSFVLIALILGLALSIERIIYLNLATTNTKSLLDSIEDALANGGVDAAKEVCRNTRGPVASIFYQGLERSSEGVEMVEKSVISYGGVQMGLLERGLSWIGLGGIKVALITTVSGLIVAIILQIFYNYIVSKIDSLVNQMEDASISLIDILVKHEVSSK